MLKRAHILCLIFALCGAAASRASVVISSSSYGGSLTLSVSGSTNAIIPGLSGGSIIKTGNLNYWTTDWSSVLTVGNLMTALPATVTVQSTFTAETNPTPVMGTTGQEVILRRAGGTAPIGISLAPSSGPAAFQTSWVSMQSGQTELHLPLAAITQSVLLKIYVPNQPVILLPVVPVPAVNATPVMSVIAPSTLSEAAAPETFAVMVHDSARVSENTILTLTSSAPDRLIVPPSLLIEKGESFATATMRVIADRLGHPDEEVTITARHPDGTTATAVVRVKDRDAHHLDIEPVGAVTNGRSFRVSFSVRDGAGRLLDTNPGPSGWAFRVLPEGRAILDDPPYVSGNVGYADLTLLDAPASAHLELTCEGGISGLSNDFTVAPLQGRPITVRDPPPSVRVNEPVPATTTTDAAYADKMNLFLAETAKEIISGKTNDAESAHPFATVTDKEVATTWPLDDTLGDAWITSLALLVKTPPPPMERVTIQLMQRYLPAPVRQVVFSAPVTITKPGWHVFEFVQPFYHQAGPCEVRFIVSNPTRMTTTGTVAATAGTDVKVNDDRSTLMPILKLGLRPVQPLSLSGSALATAGAWSGAWSAGLPGKNLQVLALDAQQWRYGFSAGKTTVSQIGAVKLSLRGELMEGAADATLTVSLPKPTSTALTVTLTGADSDFTLPATVIIPAGKSAAIVAIHAVDDSIVEDTETKTITATAPGYAGATLDAALKDNGDTLGLTVTLPASIEEGFTFSPPSIVVTADAAPERNVFLNVSMDDPRTPVWNSMVINKGETSATQRFQISTDNYPSGDRVVTFTVQGNGARPATATCLVTDSDKRAPTVILNHGYHQGRDTIYQAIINPVSGMRSDFVATFTSEDPQRLEVPASKLVPVAGGPPTIQVVAHDLPDLRGAGEASFTMHIAGFPDLVTKVPVPDYDAHHLAFDPMPATQPRGQPLLLRVKAKTMDNLDADFKAVAIISAHDASGAEVRVEVDGGAGRFNDGLWTGNVRVRDLARGVVIVLRTHEGVLGESAPFDIVDGPLHHFDFSTLPASAAVNTPFPITLTARDDQGNLITSYTGAPTLNAVTTGSEKQSSASGEFTWDNYRQQSPAVNVASAVQRRTQSYYLAAEVGKSKTLRQLRLPLVPTDALPVWLRHCTLRLQRATAAPTAFVTSGWTTVFSGDVLVADQNELVFPFSVPFEHVGSFGLLVDLSFDNPEALIQTRSGWGANWLTGACLTREVAAADGNPLDWSQTSLSPSVSLSWPRPDFIFSGLTTLAMSPTTTTAFTNGQWSGNVRLLNAAPGVKLRAETHVTSDSAAFDVVAAQRLVLQAPDTAVEGAAAVAVTVMREGDTRTALTVEVVADLPAALTGLPATVTIPAGASSATLNVQAVDDHVPQEVHAVVLTATASVCASASTPLRVTDDGSSRVIITMPATVAESAGTVTARVGIGRVRSQPTTIYLFSSDAATGFTNRYLIPPSTVTLPAGAVSMDVAMQVVNDDTITPDRHVTVHASTPGTGLANATQTITIREDDALALAFVNPSETIREGGTIYSTISRGVIQDTSLQVTVTSSDPDRVRIWDGTSRGAASSTFYFDSGQRYDSIQLLAVDDALRNGRGSSVLTLSSPGMASATMTVTVTDNEVDHLAFGTVPAALAQNATATTRVSMLTVDGDRIADVSYGYDAIFSVEVDGRWIRNFIWPDYTKTQISPDIPLPTDVPGRVTLWARNNDAPSDFTRSTPARGTSVTYEVTPTTPVAARYQFDEIASPQQSQSVTRGRLHALDATGTQLSTDPGSAKVALVRDVFEEISGTASGTTDYPFHLNEKAGRMQIFVPRSAFSNNGSRWFTSLALKVATASSTPVEHLVVRMLGAHPLLGATWANGVWQRSDQFTTVFSGRHTFDTTGWHTLALQNAFMLNEQQDLLVDISYANAGTGTPVVLEAIAGSARQRSTDALELQQPTMWPGSNSAMEGTVATLVPMMRLGGYLGLPPDDGVYPSNGGLLGSFNLPGGEREITFTPALAITARLLATAWNGTQPAVSNSFQVTTPPIIPQLPILPMPAVTLPTSLRPEDGWVPDAGRVTLPNTMPLALTVMLSCNDGRVLLPAAVIIPAGETSATFSLRALLKPRPNDGAGPDNVTIIAKATALGYQERTGFSSSMALTTNIVPKLVLHFPKEVKPGITPSTPSIDFLDLGPGKDAPVTVWFSSSNPAVDVFPRQLVLSPSSSGQGIYLYARLNNTATGTQETTITASANGWVSSTAQVTCYQWPQQSLSLTSAENQSWPGLVEGGVFHLTVYRSTTGSPLRVKLTNSDPGRVPLPAYVTFRKDQFETTVAVRVANDSTPSPGHSFEVRAFAPGYQPALMSTLIQDTDFWRYSVEMNDFAPAGGKAIVTFRGLDGGGNTIPSFNNTLYLSARDSAGRSLRLNEPRQVRLQNGFVVSEVALLAPAKGVRLTATDAEGRSASALLGDFVAGPADAPVIAPIKGPARIGQPFTISVSAIEAASGFVDETFTGMMSLQVVNIGGERSIVPVSPSQIGPFMKGRWTGPVIFDQAAARARVVVSLRSHSIDSNDFRIDPAGTLSLIVPPSISTGGNAVPMGRVQLDRTTAVPLTVSLSSDASSVLSVPAQVTISVGEREVTFPLTAAHSVRGALSAGYVTLRASAHGYADTGAATKLVPDGPVAGFAVQGPASAQAGAPFPITVRALDAKGSVVTAFNGAAPLSLSSDSGRTERRIVGPVINADPWPKQELVSSQFIYRREELGGPMMIRQVVLEFASPIRYSGNLIYVSLKHTLLEAFPSTSVRTDGDWTYGETYFDPATDVSEGRLVIHLRTPFEYDGVSHLMVKMDGLPTWAPLKTTRFGSLPRAQHLLPNEKLVGNLFRTAVQPIMTSTVMPVMSFADELPASLTSKVTGRFDRGVWTGLISIDQALPGARIGAGDAEDGKSAAFDVLPPPPVILNGRALVKSTAGTLVDMGVQWAPALGASAYRVEASPDASFGSEVTRSPWLNATSHTFPAMPSNRLHHFRVLQRTDFAARDGLWQQTREVDFAPNRGSGLSITQTPDAVELSRESQTTVESFDAGFAQLTQNIYLLTATTRVVNDKVPAASTQLPIRQFSDPVGKLVGRGARLTAQSDSFSDGTVDAWFYPQLGGSASLQDSLLLRANSTHAHYMARIFTEARGVQFALLRGDLNFDFTTLVPLCLPVELKPLGANENWHLIFSAKGPVLNAQLWRVSASGAVKAAELSAVDYLVSSGQAGVLHEGGDTGATLVDDLTITGDRAATFNRSGSFVTRTLRPGGAFERWGRVQFNATQPTGTAALVDVLDASGQVLASGLSNGADLDSLSAVARSTALQLRLRLTSTTGASTPLLNDWSLSYHVADAASLQSGWSATFPRVAVASRLASAAAARRADSVITSVKTATPRITDAASLRAYAFPATAAAASTAPPCTGCILADPAESQRYLTVTYTRRREATAADYAIELSHDLTTWTDAGTRAQELQTQPQADGVTETVTVRILPAITSGTTCFVRIRATAR